MPDNSTVATQTLKAEPGKPVILPAGETAANAEFTREGQDLCLSSDGHMVRIEGYFAQDPAPDVVTADGAARFTPQLVDSFLPPQHPGEYAQGPGNTATDLTGAVGKITKLEGDATITRADGTKTKAELGAIIFQGDVITTGQKGAVNIIFADNTSFSISRNAKLAVDEFDYDPKEHSGTSFFSMTQGVFVYQSGDIGKDDPSKVNINTPVGSIGIRGTLVAGEINPPGQESKVTIVDGAVIITNGGGELVLNDAFETATLTGYGATATNIGQLDSNTFASTYSSVAPVAVTTFSAVASGTYQPAPATSTGDSTPQQTTQPAPGDGVTVKPEGTDGTVQPPPPGSGPMIVPQDGTVAPPPPTAPGTQLSPDGTIMPPPPAPAPQDGMMQPLPGTQPMPGTQVIAGTDGTLPPPPTGSTFTDSTTGTFPPPAGSTFGGTTVLPPPPGGTTVTTAPPPPPPPPPPGGTSGDTATAPPPPMAQFVFAPVYLNGTPGDTSDDGVPIFGTGLNASTTNPVLIGQVQLQNFAAAPNITITSLNANFDSSTGEFTGNTLRYTNTAAAPTPFNMDTTPTTGVVLDFDAQGRLFLKDPTGMITNLNNNGYFTFRVVVDDNNGNTYYDQNITVQVRMSQDTGNTAITTFVGDHSAAGLDIAGQAPLNDSMPDIVTNGMYFGGGGDDQMQAGGGNDILVGGLGADLMAATGSTGSVKMFGMLGDDTLKFFMPSMLFNPNSSADGGAGMDTLILGTLGGGMNFDFASNANKVFGIEKLSVELGLSSANQVRLDAQDIFEMTGPGHVLRLTAVGATGSTAEVYLGNTGTANDLTQVSSAGGQVTYTGYHNNQTVTLIIETDPGLTVIPV